jgi:peptide chain release factor 2
MVGWVCTTLNYMNESDLLIEPHPPARTGGQHVGIVSSAVQVTHIPTELTVVCSHERSQVRNKNFALQMIEYGLTLLKNENN